MGKIKLAKNELKKWKDRLKRYHRYLPTLNIKKQRLRKEILNIRGELATIETATQKKWSEMAPWMGLMAEDVNLTSFLQLKTIVTNKDNIAGAEIDTFEEVLFELTEYDLFATPLWVDTALESIQNLILMRAKQLVLESQEQTIQNELRVTAQRVNLFEKIKIPEAKDAIRRIHIYLGDQQTAAVGWAGLAKKKILQKSQ